MPGTAGASWSGYKARFRAIFHGADPKVLVAFWLFGTATSCLHFPSPFIPHRLLLSHSSAVTVTLADPSSHRSHKQRPLRNNPLRRPRPSRAPRAKIRRPPRRCPTLLPHQAHRSILYSPGLIPAENHNILPLVVKWHAVDSLDSAT